MVLFTWTIRNVWKKPMKTVILLLTTFSAGSLLASVPSKADQTDTEQTKNLGEKEILPKKRGADSFLIAPIPACMVPPGEENNLLEHCTKQDNKLWIKAI